MTLLAWKECLRRRKRFISNTELELSGNRKRLRRPQHQNKKWVGDLEQLSSWVAERVEWALPLACSLRVYSVSYICLSPLKLISLSNSVLSQHWTWTATPLRTELTELHSPSCTEDILTVRAPLTRSRLLFDVLHQSHQFHQHHQLDSNAHSR